MPSKINATLTKITGELTTKDKEIGSNLADINKRINNLDIIIKNLDNKLTRIPKNIFGEILSSLKGNIFSVSDKLNAIKFKYNNNHTNIVQNNNNIYSNTLTTYTKVAQYTIKNLTTNPSSVAFRTQLKTSDAGYTVWCKLYKNDTPIAETEHNNSNLNYVTYYDDISVSNNDLIKLYIKLTSSGATVYTTNFAIMGIVSTNLAI